MPLAGAIPKDPSFRVVRICDVDQDRLEEAQASLSTPPDMYCRSALAGERHRALSGGRCARELSSSSPFRAELRSSLLKAVPLTHPDPERHRGEGGRWMRVSAIEIPTHSEIAILLHLP